MKKRNSTPVDVLNALVLPMICVVTPGAFDTVVIGQRSAFKTSTGLEVRFFMPVLNVPFRLIFAYNPQRVGVRDLNFVPQSAFSFHFAVGTMF